MGKTSARILIVGPEGLTTEETRALKEACEDLGARTYAFRTDALFKFAELRPHIVAATHLLLILDREDHERASTILLSADTLGNAKVALLCLHTCESLKHFKHRIRGRSVELIVVRSFAEHARARTEWGGVHMLVADPADLRKSARDIARSLLGSASSEQ